MLRNISMSDEPPLSHADLRRLFEHLDRAAMNGYECDHSFALTTDFLQQRGLPLEPILAWLSENGAGCDCEIMFNVAQQWDHVVGYVAPDDESEEDAQTKPWWKFW
jgi:hypothetical protein